MISSATGKVQGKSDVVIFCHPDESELRAVRGILELFGQASGLRTNFTKCSVS
jgi:hypothetical protein